MNHMKVTVLTCWRAAVSAAAFGLIFSVNGSEISPRVAAPAIPKTSAPLADYGGVGNGVMLNTEAFARAIASLSEKGGGKLVVSPGIWLTGPIKLRSNINLHLERGALLKFSGDYRLYPLTVIDLKGEKEVDSTSPISGEDLENVAITGEGIIDGGGDAWRPVKKGKLTDNDWRVLVKSGGVLSESGDTWWPSREAMAGGKTWRHCGRPDRLSWRTTSLITNSCGPKCCGSSAAGKFCSKA